MSYSIFNKMTFSTDGAVLQPLGQSSGWGSRLLHCGLHSRGTPEAAGPGFDSPGWAGTRAAGLSLPGAPTGACLELNQFPRSHQSRVCRQNTSEDPREHQEVGLFSMHVEISFISKILKRLCSLQLEREKPAGGSCSPGRGDGESESWREDRRAGERRIHHSSHARRPYEFPQTTGRLLFLSLACDIEKHMSWPLFFFPAFILTGCPKRSDLPSGQTKVYHRQCSEPVRWDSSWHHQANTRTSTVLKWCWGEGNT